MWEPASPQIWSLPFPWGLITVADPGLLKTPHLRDRLLMKEHPLGVGDTTVREGASWGLPHRLIVRQVNVQGCWEGNALREP